MLTLNVWGRQGEWPRRRTVLVDGLRDLDPDLIAFQEVVADDDYDQVRELLGADVHVAHQTVGLIGDGNHGASIASRWPILRTWEADIQLGSRTADYPCGTLIAEVAAPEPVGSLLFVAYGPWYPWDAERERELQAVRAARVIEEVARARRLPVVLAGDFNAVPDAASVRFWAGRQSLDGLSVCYRDAWEDRRPADAGFTVSPRNPLRVEAGTRKEPGRRIDYVFVRCGEQDVPFDVLDCALAFAEPVGGVWASDHFGVIADLGVPRAAERGEAGTSSVRPRARSEPSRRVR